MNEGFVSVSVYRLVKLSAPNSIYLVALFHKFHTQFMHVNMLSTVPGQNNTRFSDVYLKRFKRFPEKNRSRKCGSKYFVYLKNTRTQN